MAKKEAVGTVNLSEALLRRVRKAGKLHRYTIRSIVEAGAELRLEELKQVEQEAFRETLRDDAARARKEWGDAEDHRIA